MRNPPRFATALVPLLLAAVPLSARATPVEPSTVREAIEIAWSAAALPGFTLEIRRVPQLTHHGGVPEIEALFPERALRAGPRAIPVNLRIDGRVVARGLANIVVRERITVWVPIRPIERGAVVTTADLRPEPYTYDHDPHRLFGGPGDLRWVATRDLEDGQILRPSDLDRKPDVAAGDAIILVSRAGDASVTVAGRARRAGCIGDTILVLNPITNAIVRARIVDCSTAMLVAPGLPGERSDS